MTLVNCRLIVGAWLVAFAVALPSRPAVAQTALPTASEIVARHVAALGGQRAYKAIQSMRARGRVALTPQGEPGDIEVLSARPALLLYRADFPGVGRVERGYDGRRGWSLSPAAGAKLLAGRQLTEAADEAWFDRTLHEPQRLRRIVVLGREMFDARPAYKVRVVLASGNEQVEYFDVESGWQIGIEASRSTPRGIVPVVNIMRDYKRFGALMQATTFVQRALGSEQVVTLTSWEHDVVPTASFGMPPQVRALVVRPR